MGLYFLAQRMTPFLPNHMITGHDKTAPCQKKILTWIDRIPKTQHPSEVFSPFEGADKVGLKLYGTIKVELVSRFLLMLNLFWGSVPVETYSRNWIWPRSIFIIGSVWPWNWYCTHINLNNVILWGIIPICKIFAKRWHCSFLFWGALQFLTFRVH